MAALSRQVNGFFAIYLPWLLARDFRNIYKPAEARAAGFAYHSIGRA